MTSRRSQRINSQGSSDLVITSRRSQRKKSQGSSERDQIVNIKESNNVKGVALVQMQDNAGENKKRRATHQKKNTEANKRKRPQRDDNTNVEKNAEMKKGARINLEVM